jgi:hypothetical protein
LLGLNRRSWFAIPLDPRSLVARYG